jgi:hypothetical protein
VVKLVRVDDISELSLVPSISVYWTSIPKVAGSIPTVQREPAARYVFRKTF